MLRYKPSVLDCLVHIAEGGANVARDAGDEGQGGGAERRPAANAATTRRRPAEQIVIRCGERQRKSVA